MTNGNKSLRTNPDQVFTILIIEDDRDLVALNEITLKRGGFKTISATSGEKGVQLAIERLPDLIVCDIMMPEMDGYEVLSILRNNSQTATIPFIFMTARSTTDDIRAGMLRGADGYLIKPVSNEQLASTIKEHLGRAHLLRSQRLQEFAQRIVQMQSHERQRIARNLQTEIYQPLVSLEFLLRLHDEGSKATATDNNGSDLTPLLRQAIANLDRIVQELHPTALDDLTLPASLRSLIEQYDLAIQLEMNNLNHAFDEETKVIVFRVIQEALNNMEQHAHVQRGSVIVSYEDNCLNIQIRDKGVGFDVEAKLNAPQNVGLMSMYEQILSLSGELRIVSTTETGTQIDIRLPQGEAPSIPLYQEYDANFSKALRQSAPGRSTNSGTNTDLRADIAVAMSSLHMVYGMNRLLAQSPNFRVVREITQITGEEILAAVREAKPHVLLINPFAGNHNHHEIIQAVAEQFPKTHILVVSPYTSREYVISAFEHGAKGYVPLNTTRVDLFTAVSNVMRGKPYLSPMIPDPANLVK